MASIKTCLHTFTMGDVEDPYLYASQPIYTWQQTEQGKWCMEHALEEPTFFCNMDMASMGYRVAIIGLLEEKDHTYFMLKWGSVQQI